MLALTFALLAAVATDQPAPAPASNTVSPVTVSRAPDKGPIAATIESHSEQQSPWGGDFTSIWPAGALTAGVTGHVVLNCLIDAHGLAESCKIASETPPGKKLGEAALQLRPTFKIKPATGVDGQPVSAVMALNIVFKPPAQEFDNEKAMDQVYKHIVDRSSAQRNVSGVFGTLDLPSTGNKIAMRNVTMMDNPVWIQAASFDDLAAAYPAAGGGEEGYAAAHCRVERDSAKAGTLRDCQILKETPANRGFGKAALELTAKFRTDPAPLARAPNHDQIWVDIQMRLPPPAAIAEHTITAPRWIVTVDPKILPQLFPPQAAARGLTDGEGVARCHVAGDGTLTGCVPEAADPGGLGFAEVAVRVASKMRMNLWSADGAPINDGVVHVPVRLNLNGES